MLVPSEEWYSLLAVTTTEQKERSNEDWRGGERKEDGDAWQQATLTERVNISIWITQSVFTHTHMCIVIGAG